MIIVSDATPIRYLVEIEKVHVLEKLFGQVVIPQRVCSELQGQNTPPEVIAWIQNLPAWLEVRQADISLFTPKAKIQDGEREAIALALELSAGAILMDDKNARREAKAAGLLIIPTLAILEQAAQRGLIDLPEAIDLLSKTSFRAPKKLFEQVLERDRQRKQSEAEAIQQTDHQN
jgi:predicted nucleic acid-binding protein